MKTVIKKDYNKLESLLKLDRYIADDYANLLHVLFYMHINGYIDDDQIFSVCYLVVSRKIKFRNIAHLVDKINDLDVNRSSKIHYFLKIKRDLLLIDDGINDILNKLKDTSGNKKFDRLNNHNFHDYACSELSKLVNSFTDTSFLNYVQLNNASQLGMWTSVHENEIKRRLLLLVKLLGCKTISFMGVSIIANSTFECMTFDEKVAYYKDCATRLTISINTMKDIAKKRRKLQLSENTFDKQYNGIKESIENHDNRSSFNTLMTNLIDKYLN